MAPCGGPEGSTYMDAAIYITQSSASRKGRVMPPNLAATIREEESPEEDSKGPQQAQAHASRSSQVRRAARAGWPGLWAAARRCLQSPAVAAAAAAPPRPARQHAPLLLPPSMASAPERGPLQAQSQCHISCLVYASSGQWSGSGCQ